MRYFIHLAYNGTKYHGWQIQPNAVTVQETLSRALSLLLLEKIEITGAGRTDSGVHARQMYAHFDFEGYFELSQLRHKLNSFLPKDIAVFEIIPVADDAHARFDAQSRSYEYWMHSQKDVFLENLSTHYRHALDFEKMNQAAQLLLNHSDFQCFSKSNTDVGTYNCTIASARWEQQGHRFVFYITADRFLRNMVRAIVGTLIDIGLHKTDIENFKHILESKDRSKAGFSVPAQGLYLTQIEYPYLKPDSAEEPIAIKN